MTQEILKMVLGEDVLGCKQLILIAEDGVIYRIPCDRLDQLTDEALINLKEGKSLEGLKGL